MDVFNYTIFLNFAQMLLYISLFHVRTISSMHYQTIRHGLLPIAELVFLGVRLFANRYLLKLYLQHRQLVCAIVATMCFLTISLYFINDFLMMCPTQNLRQVADKLIVGLVIMSSTILFLVPVNEPFNEPFNVLFCTLKDCEHARSQSKGLICLILLDDGDILYAFSC